MFYLSGFTFLGTFNEWNSRFISSGQCEPIEMSEALEKEKAEHLKKKALEEKKKNEEAKKVAEEI